MTFHQIFRAFFRAVKSTTGKDLKLKALHPNSGTLHGFTADGAVPQALGLADAILELQKGEGCQMTTDDPVVAINYWYRTCIVHFSE